MLQRSLEIGDTYACRYGTKIVAGTVCGATRRNQKNEWEIPMRFDTGTIHLVSHRDILQAWDSYEEWRNKLRLLNAMQHIQTTAFEKNVIRLANHGFGVRGEERSESGLFLSWERVSELLDQLGL